MVVTAAATVWEHHVLFFLGTDTCLPARSTSRLSSINVCF